VIADRMDDMLGRLQFPGNDDEKGAGEVADAGDEGSHAGPDPDDTPAA
jgi:hypothetical protein